MLNKFANELFSIAKVLWQLGFTIRDFIFEMHYVKTPLGQKFYYATIKAQQRYSVQECDANEVQ